jgi:hypothetical protein
METQNTTIFNHAIRWGGILGAVSILITMILYAVDYSLMVQLKTLFISLLIYLGLVIYAGINYRNSIGGFLSFGKAFQHGFLVLAISALISTIFNILLYTAIDPELPQKLTDASIENTRQMMENFGAPEDQVDEALEQARERSNDQFSVGGLALGYVWILVFSAIMALISGLIVKKNEPEAV